MKKIDIASLSGKAFTRRKISNIAWALLYFCLSAGVITSLCFLFLNRYYSVFWVNGSSMKPTINNNVKDNRHEFLTADTSSKIKSSLSRFDVILTNYPSSWIGLPEEKEMEQDSKIKRLWGLPNEVISLKKDNETGDYTFSVKSKIEDEKPFYTCTGKVNELGNISFVTETKTFATKNVTRQFENYVLKEQEYFVMGDNWGGSQDSYQYCVVSGKTDDITYHCLIGKVISVDGTCTIKTTGNKTELVNKEYYTQKRYNI